jgi:hypothetical protein
MKMVLATTDVLQINSDKESLELFRIVDHTNSNTADILISNTKDNAHPRAILKTMLTREQYYYRMSKLTKAGLIKRKKGRYTLTTFGK